MLLRSFFITPNNRKVEAFIKHFELPVEIKQIDFKHEEHKQPEYLAMNPMGKVPLLIDGDFCLWEGTAILTYLARKFPQTTALPTDTQGRADADRWLHWQSCHLMPTIGALKTGAETDKDVLKPLFKVLDGQLEGRDFVLGELSVCDFAIAAYTLTKMMRGLDYSDVPHVTAWRERTMNLKGFVETAVKERPAA